MSKRVVALTVVGLALLATLVGTGLVPIPGLAGTQGPGSDGTDAPGEADPTGDATPGLAGSGRDAGRGEAKPGDVPAPPPEDVVPAEARGTAAAQGGGVVRGRVVRGEAKVPVEGVTVRLLRPDSLFAYLRAKREGRHDDLVARTGADGRFAFRDVLPSSGYALWVKPAAGASVTKAPLEVLAKRATDAGDLLLGPSGAIGGHVVDGAGKPIAGVRVAVTWEVKNDFQVVLADPSTLPWIEAEATTDAEGAWAVRALEPGAKTVVMRAPSGAAQVLPPVEVKDGDKRTDVDATLGGTLFLSGTVTWDDGTPVAQARVWAKAVRGPAAHTMDTAADGAIRLGPLSEGTYQIGAMITGMPVHVGKAVKAGADDVRITFARPGALSGTVVSATSGKPLTRFRVTPSFAAEQDMIAKYVSERIQRVLGPTGFASADGSFRFERLQPGPYTLVVEADGYPRFEASDVVVVVGKESIVPAIAVPDGHRAAGIVVDASGRPAADVRVFLSADVRAEDVEPEEMGGAVSEMDADAVTDESGAFETGLLTPGVYRLGAMAEGRMPGTIERLDLRTGSQRDLRVTLAAGGGIVVRLLDVNGKPAPNQGVAFAHEDGFLQTMQTDEKGVATVAPARTGRWVVAWMSRAVRGSVWPRAAPGAAGPVAQPTPQQRFDLLRTTQGAEEFPIADGTRRDVTIRLPRLVRLKGRARYDGRVPVGSQIGLWTGAAWTEGRLDAEGRFEFAHVEPGLCHVYLSVPGDEAASWLRRDVQVPDTIEHVLDLEYGR